MFTENVKIKYIYHSCYSVELEDKLIIFDYYKGNLPDEIPGKQTIFISTHSHADHFNKEILKLPYMKNCIYILSDDIKELYKSNNIIYLNDENKDIDIDTLKIIKNANNIYFVKPDEQLTIDDMVINTYGSTDKGISILVDLPFLNLYHAGDLNNWIWPEDTKTEREKMENSFIKELEKIDIDEIDIAFFPIDPRLKDEVFTGAEIFLDIVSPAVLFPMHFSDNYDITKKFSDYYSDFYTDIKTIYHRDESFDIIIEIDEDDGY